jgi:ABC-type uncharacterized transport system substrate-binding protein
MAHNRSKTRKLLQVFGALLLTGCFILKVAPTTAVVAHPHIWVSFQSTVAFERGSMVSVRHIFTFNELYTSLVTEGLDVNNDQHFDAQELLGLTSDFFEVLSEFSYYTTATLAGEAIRIGEPTEFRLDLTDGVLTLHMNLPFVTPISAPGPELILEVFDPTILIAFEPAPPERFALSSGAPPGCRIALDIESDEGFPASSMEQFFPDGFTGLPPTGFTSVIVSCLS